MRQNESLHYLDNAATTLVAPQVADAIYKTMTEHWGNPSSLYGPGQASRRLLDRARAAVAATLGAGAGEVFFTGCGSESNNIGAPQRLGQKDRGERVRAPQRCAAHAAAGGKGL